MQKYTNAPEAHHKTSQTIQWQQRPQNFTKPEALAKSTAFLWHSTYYRSQFSFAQVHTATIHLITTHTQKPKDILLKIKRDTNRIIAVFSKNYRKSAHFSSPPFSEDLVKYVTPISLSAQPQALSEMLQRIFFIFTGGSNFIPTKQKLIQIWHILD